MNSLFHYEERGSSIGTELRAGLTTFLALAYIIAVNPTVLSAAGIDKGALACATCLGAGVMTLSMGVFSNRPIACASGLGINAMFDGITAGVCGGDWHVAMGVIMLEGVAILLLVVCGLREAIMDATPVVLRHAISVGLGLFIAMIGLMNANVIVIEDNAIGLGSLCSPAFVVGVSSIVVTVTLASREVPGALLVGIVAGVILGIPLGVTQPPTSLVAPLDLSTIGAPLARTADGSPAIVRVLTSPTLLIVSFSLLMSDFFDTMGTAMAIGKQGGFLTEDGHVEDIRAIMIVDSAAAAVGGLFGVSSITTSVESSAGAADGGRTGLASIATGTLFVLAAFFSPVLACVPGAATCGALVYVGYLMIGEVTEIDWSDVTQGFPAFLIVAGISFMYSISSGIGLGFVAHVVIRVLRGEARQIKPLLWVTAVAFLAYFLVSYGPMEPLLG